MAIQPTPEGSRGIFKAVKDAMSIFGPTNKADGIAEDTNPQPIDEYESKMSDKEIIELVAQWRRTYSVYYRPIEEDQKLAFKYWVGEHRQDEGEPTTKSHQNQVDNLIFEAVETFLPIATRANPEPLVTADPSDVGQKLANDIRVALVHEADEQKLRRKLARMTRQWVINRLGALKVSWDVRTKSIATEVVNVKKLILDKDGYIDEGGNFHGKYIGEKKTATAYDLIEMFPKHRTYLTEKVRGKMGTEIEYTEWWYCGTDVFYTHEATVLGKYKNPHWNYDGESEEPDPETGEPTKVVVQGSNHLKEPPYPYRFLSVFNTGTQPHDDTSLILQNIPIQDRINRRYRQIDHNVKSMNNGLVVSGTAFTEEQASQAASALRRGMAIRVPNGNVNDAVMRPNIPGLPGDVFNALQDDRNELRNIFGTSGSTPEGTEQQKTVRGKILINQLDSSRIGGGITECIEQVADSVYNLWVQFMYVYYDEEHYISSAGAMNGVELITIKNSMFPGLRTLTITVKEGSLIPKDPLTQRNEAVDLWSQNAIDPLTFFKRLDVPNPSEATQQLMLWQLYQKGAIQPNQYLPSFEIPQPQAPVEQQTSVPGAQGQTGAPESPSLQEQPATGGPKVNAPQGADLSPTGALQRGLGGPVESKSAQLLRQVPAR